VSDFETASYPLIPLQGAYGEHIRFYNPENLTLNQEMAYSAIKIVADKLYENGNLELNTL
jgi:hypothetical protein